jgi:hypothetical protein
MKKNSRHLFQARCPEERKLFCPWGRSGHKLFSLAFYLKEEGTKLLSLPRRRGLSCFLFQGGWD